MGMPLTADLGRISFLEPREIVPSTFYIVYIPSEYKFLKFIIEH